MSDNTSALETKELTPEEVEKVKENFSKLLAPFRIDVTHRDDDGNEGETSFTIQAPTILGALSCLNKFSTFRENGWKAILVQELFDESERDLVNPAEVNRRVTDRLVDEDAKTFREGVLGFNYSYSHTFLKEEREERLTITYKYNQVLHLVQMINTVLTDKFSSGIIDSIMKDLDSETGPASHNIKL